MSRPKHTHDSTGYPVTEMQYQLETEDGWVGPALSRAPGHLSTIEMVMWIEAKRTKAYELENAARKATP